jgi:paraquat-inducible protein B
MSRKVNKTAIGAFVVSAVVLLIIAILVFGSGGLFKDSEKYIVFFNGSVKGLSVGAPVVFRGVKIGSVNKINLSYNPKAKDVFIAVIIDSELSRVEGIPGKLGYPNYKKLIERGLRAKLEIQNFITGQLMVSFDFYPSKPVILQEITREYPELPALPISPDIFAVMDDLPIKEISNNLKKITAGIDNLFNSGELNEDFYELKNTLKEVTQTARSLRLLTEYLEQYPEALLKGKPDLK